MRKISSIYTGYGVLQTPIIFYNERRNNIFYYGYKYYKNFT